MAELTEIPSPHVEGLGSNPNAIHSKHIVVVGKQGAAAARRFVGKEFMTSCIIVMGVHVGES